ncbi:hypothetical protein [Flavobacterium ginsengisoli]|uniref:hypothetical protein n=1 Tax=Flavobacterium ginsengisoli TaxID=871694 RepID=UPI00241568E4|nr:hypothetical protein [Flavobacterium ginsengisoli]
MKNKLLPLFVIFGAYSAYSQVGVGTLEPNKSAQLEVFSNDKGILIPRVKLKSSTDRVTVTNGNTGYEDSLLVFAIDTIDDIKPGYYYWYNEKWNRIVVSGEIPATTGTVIYNSTTNQFSYMDNAGNLKVIDMEEIVKTNQTVTRIINNGSGSYTYKNEAGDEVTINVINDVADNFQTIVNNRDVKRIIENIVNKTEGNISYNAETTEFTYTDKNGDSQFVDIKEIVKANETVTEIANNGSGSYTYKNEAGDEVTIDVINDVADNFQTIVNNGDVKRIIENIVNKTEGNISYNAETTEFTYTDKNGDTQIVDMKEIVKANETVTEIANNGSGSYTYKNEAGDEVTIDVINDVADNFQTIVNNGDVKRIIENIVNKTEGNISYNAETTEFTYTDKNGDTQIVDMKEIVKANETVTEIANNGSGSYTYKNEKDKEFTIDVVNDVADNFQTIVDNQQVKRIIENIVKKTEGNILYDACNNRI